MVSLKKMMLGAALVAGTLGLGTAPAHAARSSQNWVYVGGPAAYIPPSPGPGYVWVDGYYGHPGFWRAPVVGFGYRYGGPVFHHRLVQERGFERFRR